MQADVQTSEFLQEDETNAEKNVNNNQKIIKNKKKKRRKRGRPVEERSWSHYIYQVLKRDVPPPSNGITKKAMDVLDNMTKHLIELILNETNTLCKKQKEKRKATSRHVQTGVRLLFKGDLATRVVSNGCKAVTKYFSALDFGMDEEEEERTTTEKKRSRAGRAGIIFPPSLALHWWRQKTRLRFGEGAPIYLAAVLETVISEVLALAGEAAKDSKRHTITPRHINEAIHQDVDLHALLHEVIIPQSGAVGFIHPRLLPKKKKAKQLKLFTEN